MSSIPKKIFIIPYRDREQHKQLFIHYMKYVMEEDKHTKYDMVITMRIDYAKDIKFKLENIIKSKIYVSAIHRKRLIS